LDRIVQQLLKRDLSNTKGLYAKQKPPLKPSLQNCY